MAPRTIALKTHSYTDPCVFFLGSDTIREAIAEHDKVRTKLLLEKTQELTAEGNWELIRSIGASRNTRENDRALFSEDSPLELFFRAIAMGPYEQRELDKLRPSGSDASSDVLDDARLYVEQLAYSLESINRFDGSKISFPPATQQRMRMALRLDDMIREVRRIYAACQNKQDGIVVPHNEHWGLPRKEQEIRAHFAHGLKYTTSLTFMPTRGPLMELLGSNSGTCVGRLRNLARTYDEATAIVFVIDKEFPLLMGGCLLFRSSVNGAPVLVIRGFNPTYELLDRVTAGELFEKFADYACDLARAGGFSAVVMPHADFWHNAGSIRVPIFFYVQEMYGQEPVLELDESQVVKFNGLSSRNVVAIRKVR